MICAFIVHFQCTRVGCFLFVFLIKFSLNSQSYTDLIKLIGIKVTISKKILIYCQNILTSSCMKSFLERPPRHCTIHSAKSKCVPSPIMNLNDPEKVKFSIPSLYFPVSLPIRTINCMEQNPLPATAITLLPKKL